MPKRILATIIVFCLVVPLWAALPLSDNFDDENITGWTQISTLAIANVTGGDVIGVENEYGCYYWSGDTVPGNHYSQIEVTDVLGGAQLAAALVNVSTDTGDGSMDWYGLWTDGDSLTFLRERVNGVDTDNYTGVPYADGDILRLDRVGNDLIARKNGSIIYTLMGETTLSANTRAGWCLFSEATLDDALIDIIAAAAGGGWKSLLGVGK